MEERTITVTDKNGVKIAVFSNQTSIHSDNAKKNIMVAPIVDIVSNGESTLTFQMLAASDKWQQIKNPENLYYCNNRVYTALNEQSIVYNGLTVTVTLVELWYLLRYKYVQAHNVNTKVEALDEHTVKILPKTDKKYKLTVNGVAYDDSQVKDSRGVVMPRGSAGYALWALLKGTDWTLGVCDVLPDGFDASKDYGSFNVETDMKDVLENIQFVQSMYGGILDWDSQHKILNLRDETKENTDFNKWKGFVVRQGKNVTEFPSITWDNNIITRLYPLGSGNLNIAKVNNNKNYVDDFSYTDRIYEGYMQNPNIYDTNDEGGQKTLKFWGQQQVKKLSHPRKSVRYEIVDKRGTSEGWTEPFDVNDVIKAYYPDTETGKEVWEYLRIQHLTYNWFWPGSDTTIEVGDKVANETELFYQIYKDVDKSIKTDNNGNISGDDIVVEIPEEYWDMFGGYGYSNLTYLTRIHAEHETENSQAVADLSAYADDTFATIDSFTTFQKQTADEFQQSWTQINQTSSALQAQITLEAGHYKETQKSITDTNAKITATANDLSAQITAEARYRQEGDKKSTDAVASLRTYVDGEFATAQLRAAYTYVDNEIDDVNKSVNNVKYSLAEFEAYADKNYASASVVSNLNGTVASIKTQVNSISNGDFGSATISADGITIRGGYVTIGNSGTITVNDGNFSNLYGSSISLGGADLYAGYIDVGDSSYKVIKWR